MIATEVGEHLPPNVARFIPREPTEVVSPLLPAQRQLVTTTKPRSVTVGGVGSGKSRGVITFANRLGTENPGCKGIFVEPNYSLVKTEILPAFESLYAEWGMEEGYDYVVTRSSPPEIQVFLGDCEFTILFRSGKNLDGLIGINAAWALIDEAERCSDEAIDFTCQRVRDPKGRRHHVGLAGVPEVLHGRFFEWATCGDDDIEQVRAKTTDNFLLPSNFIDTFLGHYSEEDKRRYVNGEFIAPGGRVYECYDTDKHEAPCVDPFRGEQVMAVDFGYGCMPFIMGRVIGGQDVHYHHEQVLEGASEYEAIQQAARWWAGFFKRWTGQDLTPYEAARQVDCFPDPAGGKEYSKTHIKMLREAGFHCHHPRRHTPVRDRVNSLTRKIYQNEVLVDPEGCPYLSRCLRHHAYDPNTGKPRKHRSREGKKGYDHGCDAVGYHVDFKWPAGRRPTRMINLS